MRRSVALVLVLLLAATVLPGRTLADVNPCLGPEVEAAGNRLQTDGIIFASTESGLVSPALEEITRAEVSWLMVRVLGREPEARQRTGEAPFADVRGHWAAGAVAVLADEQVVLGYPDGSFNPDRKISQAEAELMSARLLRLGADLTLDSASPALQHAGVDTALPACGGQFLSRGQFYVLLDRVRHAEAWSTR